MHTTKGWWQLVSLGTEQWHDRHSDDTPYAALYCWDKMKTWLLVFAYYLDVSFGICFVMRMGVFSLSKQNGWIHWLYRHMRMTTFCSMVFLIDHTLMRTFSPIDVESLWIIGHLICLQYENLFPQKKPQKKTSQAIRLDSTVMEITSF